VDDPAGQRQFVDFRFAQLVGPPYPGILDGERAAGTGADTDGLALVGHECDLLFELDAFDPPFNPRRLRRGSGIPRTLFAAILRQVERLRLLAPAPT